MYQPAKVAIENNVGHIIKRIMLELCISIKEVAKRLQTGTDLIRRYLNEDDFEITEIRYNRIVQFYDSIEHKDRISEVVDKCKVDGKQIYFSRLNTNRSLFIISEYNTTGTEVPDSVVRYLGVSNAWKTWDDIRGVEE